MRLRWRATFNPRANNKGGGDMETSRQHRALALLACSSLAWSGAVAQAQGTSPARSAAKRMEALQQQLTEQGRQIEALRQQAQEQEARYRELQERLQTQEARSAPPPESKPAATEVADTGPRPVRVGVAPSSSDAPAVPEVAPIFDQPGI